MKSKAQRQKELRNVLTPAQIERQWGFAPGTVRQAVRRGVIPYHRPDERTITIHIEDVKDYWGEPKGNETDV